MHPLLSRLLVHHLILGVGTPAHPLHHLLLGGLTHSEASWVLAWTLLLHAHHARLLHAHHTWLLHAHPRHARLLHTHSAHTRLLHAHTSHTRLLHAHHTWLLHAWLHAGLLLAHDWSLLLLLLHVWLLASTGATSSTRTLDNVILAPLNAIILNHAGQVRVKFLHLVQVELAVFAEAN